MGKVLPEYEEIPVPIEMAPEVRKEYKRLEDALKHVMKSDKKACKKILSSYMNLLTEVALQTGFADQSHFSRFFKRLIGVTPRQYAEIFGGRQA